LHWHHSLGVKQRVEPACSAALLELSDVKLDAPGAITVDKFVAQPVPMGHALGSRFIRRVRPVASFNPLRRVGVGV